MFFNPRNVFYSDVITFPSTKSAGALTLYSDEYTLSSALKSHVVIYADDLSKITDTVTVYAKGSFDGGTNWMTLGTYTDLAAGSGTLAVRKEVPYAPLVKVEVAFDSSGALASGHGIGIDVVIQEEAVQLSKDFFHNVLTLPAGSIESAYFDVTLTPGSKETAVFSVTGLPSSNGDITVDGNSVRIYNADVAEVVTLNVTGGATADGNVGVVLPSLSQVNIAVQSGDQQVEELTVTGAPTVSGNVGITLPDLAAVNVAVDGGVQHQVTMEVTLGASTDGNVSVTLPDLAAVEIGVEGGEYEVITLTVEGGATGDGTFSITFPDAAEPATVSILSTDNTANAVAGKIRGSAFTGWATGGTDAEVTFTQSTKVTSASTPTISWGDTGASGSASITNNGVAADGVNEVATKVRAGTFTGWVTSGSDATIIFTETAKQSHVASPSFSGAATGVTATISSTVEGDAADTINEAAAKIRAATYTGWVTGGSDATVTFTETAKLTHVATSSVSWGTTSATGSIAYTTAGVTPDDTAAVATKIRGGTYDGWTASGSNSTVLFTKDVAGAVSGAAGFYTNSTGVTGSITSTTPGADADTLASIATKIAAVSYTDWDCDADDVEVTFTGKVNGDLGALSFSAGTTGMTISSIVQTDGTPTPATGNVTIGGETFALSTVASANDIAADIVTHDFTNWTAEASTNRVTLTAKTLEDVTDLVVSSSATGVTFSSPVISQGIAVAASQTVNGTSLSTDGIDRINSVEVIATGVAANINNTTLFVDGSIDGSSWFRVDAAGTAFNAATTSFVTSGFVGNYARVALVTAGNGSLESGHNIVVSAALKY